MTNLNEMTTKELKEKAKELKVKNWWTLKKAELVEAIQNVETEEIEDHAIVAENSNGGVTVIAECSHEDITQNAQDDSEEVEEAADNNSIEETEEAVQDEPEKPKKNEKLIEFNGKSQNLSKWAKELNMSGQTLYARLYLSGWTVEKAFTTPTKKNKKKNEEEA